jgi:predicted nucleic acid-binding Zn ribbon protein
MKKSNDQTLKEVINELLKAYKLGDKLKEVRLIDSWEKVVGKLINKHTKNLYIKKKVLFVKLDSAALRNELSYARQKIIKALNKEAKEEVIENIVFT